ncbi:MAG: hypothetical protein N2690_01170 [Rhodocyclaceae bacterium]|nr:hypothetical protein [Rhodocyclaceae bacterium]
MKPTQKKLASGVIEGGGVSYVIERGGPAIRVLGRMDRKACGADKQVALNLPTALRDRIEALQDGGGINGAMVGLIHYALDQIEREQQTLRIDLGGGGRSV